MPQPAEVTAVADDLVARYLQAIAEWQALVARTAHLPPERRLRELVAGIDDIFDRLDVDVRDQIATTTPQVWATGATGVTGGPLTQSFTQANLPAIQALASQDYAELLHATDFVRADTKRFLRELARAGALDTLGGQTASQAGLTQVNAVQDALDGVMTVGYANGARHSLADWADTAIRTQTAKAYNAGMLGTCRAYGVEWVEIADGPACGLTYHDDPELANGLVVPIGTAESYPIAHPRCARSILPRGDITSQDGADAHNDSRDMEALEAMALEERQRAAQTTVTGRRMTVRSETQRTERRARQGRTARTPR